MRRASTSAYNYRLVLLVFPALLSPAFIAPPGQSVTLHYITLHIQVIDRAGEDGAGRLGLALRGWHERYPRCFVVCMLDMVMALFLV